ncbi:hypothetical protein DXB25_19455 [Lachnospiraceae bacterium OM02-31]|nr:hypothetical protein DXB25_19455 [Lachnospiraceae bacterium OM02-31]
MSNNLQVIHSLFDTPAGFFAVGKECIRLRCLFLLYLLFYFLFFLEFVSIILLDFKTGPKAC